MRAISRRRLFWLFAAMILSNVVLLGGCAYQLHHLAALSDETMPQAAAEECLEP